MRTYIVTCIALLAVVSFMTSCTSTSANNSPEKEDPEYCGLHDYRTGDYFQRMNPICAKAHIAHYKAQINTIQDSLPATYPSIDSTIILGARLTLAELGHIYTTAATQHADSVYVMLAADTLTNKGGIIFTLKSTDNNNYDTYEYFNFTRPCPDACPDVYALK